MKGKIEAIEIRDLEDGRSYASLVIDGEKYSLWDKDMMQRLREGDIVQYEWKQSGNFRNITSIEPENDRNYLSEKDRTIVRMSCLKSASEILSTAQLEIEKKGDFALEMAKYFEKYVLGDIEE